MSHDNEIYSRNHGVWDLTIEGFWIGRHFPVSNTSGGYHGILKQWWETYVTTASPKVLLISESPIVKREFTAAYPHWRIDILDFYPELYREHMGVESKVAEIDIFADICGLINPLAERSYDLIISQATLEHVYNPFQAMRNLVDSLAPGGVLISHTHPPAFGYHSFPRDYFRFMKDWWYDLPKFIGGGQLLLEELLMVGNLHVFTCYVKG